LGKVKCRHVPDPSSSLAKGLVPRLLSTLFTGKVSAYAGSFADHTHKMLQNNVSYAAQHGVNIMNKAVCQNANVIYAWWLKPSLDMYLGCLD